MATPSRPAPSWRPCPALIGWFMVLRRQTFAGHTLALVGFPGAAGAAVIGVNAQFGYFGFCVAAALVIAAVPRGRRRLLQRRVGRHRYDPGVRPGLWLPVRHALRRQRQRSEQPAVRELPGDHRLAGRGARRRWAPWPWPCWRPSVDRCCSHRSTPRWPQSRGVPVRALAVVFLVLLGVAAAETSQITGSLLVFALLVLPAATAQALTARPARSLTLAVALALAVTWLGLAVAYFSTYPIGFWITTRGLRRLPAGPGRAHAGPARPDVEAGEAVRIDPRRWRESVVIASLDPRGPRPMGPTRSVRVHRRNGDRRLLGAGGLLRGAAGTGVHRRRVVARRLHRCLAALAFGFDLRLGLFVATVGVALLLGPARPSGPGRRRGHRQRVRVDARPGGAVPLASSPPNGPPGTARRAPPCSSGRSWASTPARPWWRCSSGWPYGRCWSSPGPCCSPPSTHRWQRPGACLSPARDTSSWPWSGATAAEATQAVGRCSCSACWPLPPPSPSGSPLGPIAPWACRWEWPWPPSGSASPSATRPGHPTEFRHPVGDHRRLRGRGVAGSAGRARGGGSTVGLVFCQSLCQFSPSTRLVRELGSACHVQPRPPVRPRPPWPAHDGHRASRGAHRPFSRRRVGRGGRSVLDGRLVPRSGGLLGRGQPADAHHHRRAAGARRARPDRPAPAPPAVPGAGPDPAFPPGHPRRHRSGRRDQPGGVVHQHRARHPLARLRRGHGQPPGRPETPARRR